MKTILVTNRKSGVGKTTTSVNLSVELALRGYRVLLIDLDTQGHLQIGLGVKEHFLMGIHDMLEKGRFYRKSLHRTFLKNLYFIPAHVNFNISEFSAHSVVLSKIFKKIKSKTVFDFCIIDTPPTSDTLLRNSLKVSDYAIIPMQCEYLSFIGVLQFLRLFYKHISSVDSNTKILGVVPTMYNKNIEEHNKILHKLELELGQSKVLPFIRKDLKLAKSFLDGIPLSISEPKARGADDYRILTSHILNLITQKE